MNMYAHAEERPVSALEVGARATFIVRTYLHLFFAIVGFTAIEIALFQTGLIDTIAPAMLGTSWLLVLGAFVVVSWIGSRVAHTARSLGAQYAALAGYVAAEALIFAPILWIARNHYPGVISTAAVVTLGGFAALTFVAFWTRKDFSFLGAFLRWIGIAALIGIVASLVFSFSLGIWFSVGMIAFAGAAILYDTSNVLHHFPEDRYVGASLQLFASVALLFWYVLRLFMSRD